MKSVGFKIPVMNQTRWNSQYLMLSKFVEALELDPTLQLRLGAYKKHKKLGALEMKMLKELILILEPFKEATEDFQADYESVGNVIPAYLDMRNKMSLNDQRNPLLGKIHHLREVTTALHSSLEKRLHYIVTDSFYVLGK